MPLRDARRKNPENPIIPRILILTIRCNPLHVLTCGLTFLDLNGDAPIMFFRFTPRRLLWTVVVPIALVVLILALRGEL